MKSLLTATVLLFILNAPRCAHAYTAEDFASFPSMFRTSQEPSVSIVLDNSPSMLRRAHGDIFDSGREYAGYFDPRTYYSYADVKGGPRFTPDDTSGAWNGNFLNWAFMTRMDVMRKGLTGGPYDRQTQCLVATGTRMIDPDQIVGYDDSSPVMDLAGQTRFMTPHQQSLSLGPAPEQGAVHVRSKVEDHVYILRVQGKREAGALQSLRKTARIALFVSGGTEGGGLLHPMDDAENSLEAIVDSVDRMETAKDASLAQTLCAVLGYIRHDIPAAGATPSGQIPRDGERGSPGSADPFHFPNLGKNLPCSRQNVVIITDAAHCGDTVPPDSDANQWSCPGLQSEKKSEAYAATELGALALMGHTSDLRPEEGMDGQQSWTLFTVSVARLHNHLLMDAARCGNFHDRNGNGLPDLGQEYDTDENGLPDGYFEAGTNLNLREAMTRALQLATAVSTSGNGAHACAMSGQGADAGQILYQAVFFPPSAGSRSAPPWSGQIHAYFVDDLGNLREDTDGNGRLDPSCDLIVEFVGERILRHGNGGSGNATQSQQGAEELGSILDIRFPWTTSTWLNSLSDDEAACQRYAYASPTRQRHIFTFVDKDRDMVPDAGEVQPFALPDLPRTLNNGDEFHNYLTLFESGPGRIGLDQSRPEQQALDMLRTADPDAFDRVLATFAKRQVDFIRGVDVGNATVCGIADHARSRVENGVPWRLGDIVNSGPAVVGRPAENYHLVCGDRTYETFARKYADRRQVVYAGANDGMLHAFNAGFATEQRTAFGAIAGDRTPFPLGMELWAYVPYNLLPHLRWLMRPDYGEKLHVPYLDLEPRVFDARIFFGPDGMTPQDDTHPEGWGTILVTGMRLGGSLIEADIDKTDGNAFNPDIDRTMTSAYVVMDITDPEQPPRLLAEIALPRLGFTTCRPAVMPTNGRWFLVFGSGPATSTGDAGLAVLATATSEQSARLFIVDLTALATQRTVQTLAPVKDASAPLAPWAVLEENAFASDPTVIDSKLGQNAPGSVTGDMIYFGTVSGTPSTPGGMVYRLCARGRKPSQWRVEPLVDVGLPVSSAPAVSVDEAGRRWVLFGTGRSFSTRDALRESKMSVFGIMEPEPDIPGSFPLVDVDTLFDSASVEISGGNEKPQELLVRQHDTSTPRSWPWLTEQVHEAGGWRRDLPDLGEQVIERAAILGGAVLFSSVRSCGAPCESSTASRLWTLHYQTGTAVPALPGHAPGHERQPYIESGRGHPGTPGIATIRSGNTPARVINSSGTVVTIDVPMPRSVTSGVIFWKNTKN